MNGTSSGAGWCFLRALLLDDFRAVFRAAGRDLVDVATGRL